MQAILQLICVVLVLVCLFSVFYGKVNLSLACTNYHLLFLRLFGVGGRYGAVFKTVSKGTGQADCQQYDDRMDINIRIYTG